MCDRCDGKIGGCGCGSRVTGLGGNGGGVGIPMHKIAEFANTVNKDPNSRLVKSVLDKSLIDSVATDPDSPVQRVFKYLLTPNVLPLTNQQYSGRCWIFSFTNLIKRKMIGKYNLLPTFKLSQKFVLMYDHIEKCNTLLEILYFVMHKKNVPIASLEMLHLRSMYKGDGGTWDFFKNIVLKYGLVPYESYPDNMQSSHTHDLNEMLSDYICAQSPAIHAATTRAEFSKLKWDVLLNCYKMLESFLGAPPKTVTWRYSDNKGKVHECPPCTPLEFYEKYIKNLVDVSQYVALINDPRQKYPYNRMYSVELLHNVLPADVADIDLTRLPTNKYFNVKTSIMRAAIFKSIKANTAVPFAGDASKFLRHTESRLDMDVHYNDFVPFDLIYPKKFLYENFISTNSHAMLFIGCNGEKDELQVENSWGKVMPATDVELPEYPYLTMSDAWFEHYVGEIYVHISHLDAATRKLYKQLSAKTSSYTFYPFYDVFGSVATVTDDVKKPRLGGHKKRPTRKSNK